MNITSVPNTMPPDFAALLARLVAALAADETVSAKFALSVFMQHADAQHFPLAAFDITRFGSIH